MKVFDLTPHQSDTLRTTQALVNLCESQLSDARLVLENHKGRVLRELNLAPATAVSFDDAYQHVIYLGL